MNEKSENDEIQEVPTGFNDEDDDSIEAKDDSLTLVGQNKLHSNDRLIIKKLNKKFKK